MDGMIWPEGTDNKIACKTVSHDIMSSAQSSPQHDPLSNNNNNNININNINNKNDRSEALSKPLQSKLKSNPSSSDITLCKGNRKMLARFLPPPPQEKWNELIYDDAGLTYITPFHVSEQMLEFVLETCQFDCLEYIMDATGGLGGDTITFALQKSIKHVFTAELDEQRFKALKNNVEVYGLADKVTLYNGHFLTLYQSISDEEKSKAPVLVDPPWGGVNYKYLKEIGELYLNNGEGKEQVGLVGMLELCELLMKKSPCVILKLPFNYNMDTLYDNFRCKSFSSGNIVFLVIRRKNLD
eukprot:TRINITY_DN2934_c0_g1_i1.p1 TRINITY_DN2934_c0_g1~~TRINITY_DN2934_c0_g1_i1.p1  ORF type:complete len:298 (-),score=60.06 TRINITY_DN2934_c0_g1_i1:5-898(-)